MADVPSFVVTVDWATGMATVAIHGELDSSTCDLLSERLSWVMESHPQRLVLDLAGVGDRFSQQALAVIATAREQLPPESLLSVCSASTTVRRDLELAGWSGVRVSDAAEAFASAQAGRGGWHR
jgi:anti-anti-sigma regulatory factor